MTLERCPHCGGRAETRQEPDRNVDQGISLWLFQTGCPTCDIWTGSGDRGRTEEVWNRRPKPSLAGAGHFRILSETIAAIEAEYEKLPAAQRKILGQRGFSGVALNSLKRLQGQFLLPLLTGAKPTAPISIKKLADPNHDPRQMDIDDFITKESGARP